MSISYVTLLLLWCLVAFVGGVAAVEVEGIDEALKYGGLLRCQMCEDAVETLTRRHHATPLGQLARSMHNAADQKRLLARTLQARNDELVDGLCKAVLADAEASGDRGRTGVVQLHCAKVVETMDTKLVKYLTRLYEEKRPNVPVGTKKDEKTNTERDVYAKEAEVDALCKPLCSAKWDMRNSIESMKDKMKEQQQALIDNISTTQIIAEAFKLLASYWYLTIPGILSLTITVLIIQIRYFPNSLRPPPHARAGAGAAAAAAAAARQAAHPKSD